VSSMSAGAANVDAAAGAYARPLFGPNYAVLSVKPPNTSPKK
jgi:hypothetical protein